MFLKTLILGGQTSLHSVRMLREVFKKVLLWSIVLTSIITAYKVQKDITFHQLKITGAYYLAKGYSIIGKENAYINVNLTPSNNQFLKKINDLNKKSNNNKNHNSNRNNKKRFTNNSTNKFQQKHLVKFLVNNRHIISTKNLVLSKILKNTLSALLYFITFTIFFLFTFLCKGYKTLRIEHLRGAKIKSVKDLTKEIIKYNKKKFRNRTKHFKKQSKELKKLKNLNKKTQQNKQNSCKNSNNNNNNNNKLNKTQQLKTQSKPSTKYDYKIANIPYPAYSESLHTLITGGSGTGKTVIISDLIEQIRQRGDKAIIYDKMGTFVSKFYNKDTDIILNPLDQRSPSWTVFNEARNVIDFESMASALIPNPPNNVDPFFVLSARTIFVEVANALKERGNATNKELIDKVLKSKLEEASKLIQGTPAQAIIDEKNAKTSLSVMAVLSAHLKSMTHLKDDTDIINNSSKNQSSVKIKNNFKKFSIRNWVSDDNQKGFLFISSRADQHETLKPLISTWLEIAVNSLLSLKQNRERKIWIIIDELPSLHYLPSLHSGLAESRQFGGAFVLSMQLMAQLRTIYGQSKAESTSGLCRTRVILASPDEETARWCSNNLGRQEIKESKESISMGANDMRDGTNITKIEKSKPIVLSSEIMSLPNLQAYIKPAGDFAITLSKIKYKSREEVAESFVRYRKEEKKEGDIDKDKKDTDNNKNEGNGNKDSETNENSEDNQEDNNNNNTADISTPVNQSNKTNSIKKEEDNYDNSQYDPYAKKAEEHMNKLMEQRGGMYGVQMRGSYENNIKSSITKEEEIKLGKEEIIKEIKTIEADKKVKLEILGKNLKQEEKVKIEKNTKNIVSNNSEISITELKKLFES